MKKTLFTIFFLFTILHLTAKIPFPTEDVVWRNRVQGSFCFEKPSNYILSFKGDTTIDNTSYSCLALYWDSLAVEQNNISYIIGYIRTQGDSVFYLDPTDKECLLYNFSLQQGDTIRIDVKENEYDSFLISYIPLVSLNFIGKWEAVVEEVFYDSDNRKHLVLKQLDEIISEYYPKDEWIEGIGSIYGFFCNYGITAGINGKDPYRSYPIQLSCCKIKGEVIYQDCNSCFGDEEISQHIVSEAEQPSEYKVFIQNGSVKVEIKENSSTALLDLFDPTGKVILSQTISEQQTSFNLSHLPKGVLMYQITPLEGKRETGKIINQ